MKIVATIPSKMLLAVSLAVEPDARAAIVTIWSWRAIAGWLFRVIFGSLVGYSIYIQLLQDIGPARAGSFAFVSPAIAVAVGAVVAGEAITLHSVIGMALMMLAAGGCLFTDQITATFPVLRKAKPDISPEVSGSRCIPTARSKSSWSG